jgi:predicted flap endonuclease-1-like 5' DNA nuclease
MKNAIRVAGVIAGLGAAVWALRDRIMPEPSVPSANPPSFRTRGTATADDLTRIKGIGPAFAGRLVDAGITTFAGLSEQDPESLAETANTTEAAAKRWIDDAASLA